MKAVAIRTQGSIYLYVDNGKKKYLSGGKIHRFFGDKKVEVESAFKSTTTYDMYSFFLNHRGESGNLVTSKIEELIEIDLPDETEDGPGKKETSAVVISTVNSMYLYVEHENRAIIKGGKGDGCFGTDQLAVTKDRTSVIARGHRTEFIAQVFGRDIIFKPPLIYSHFLQLSSLFIVFHFDLYKLSL